MPAPNVGDQVIACEIILLPMHQQNVINQAQMEPSFTGSTEARIFKDIQHGFMLSSINVFTASSSFFWHHSMSSLHLLHDGFDDLNLRLGVHCFIPRLGFFFRTLGELMIFFLEHFIFIFFKLDFHPFLHRLTDRPARHGHLLYFSSMENLWSLSIRRIQPASFVKFIRPPSMDAISNRMRSTQRKCCPSLT